MVRILTLGLVFFLLNGSCVFAARPPRLVVKIVVSQMRYDYLEKFAPNYTEKGFGRLLSEGVNCTNARYDYINNTTVAGLVTLASGTNPSVHGILSEKWYDYTTNDPVWAAADERYFGVGIYERGGQYAPTRMIVGTVGDQLKRTRPESKIISVALDPESAVLAGGISADGAYWFDSFKGNFCTSTYYTDRLPGWVENYNGLRRADSYNSREWNMYNLPSRYVNRERSDVGDNSTGSWMFSVSRLLKRRKNFDNYDKLLVTPMGSDLLFDFVKQVVASEGLGGDDDTDLLIVTVDPTRYISEAYGPESMETEDAYYRLDANLADLIDYIENTVGKENVLFLVTSDHGSSDTFREGEKAPGGLFNVMQFKVVMNGFLNAQHGTENWVIDYHNRSLYLNRRVIYDKGLNLAEIQIQAAAFALQFRGVAQAVTSASLQNNYFSGGGMSRIQNGYYPKYSGDIVLDLMPGWIEEEEGKVSKSGSIYEYDLHVPLLWYGSGLPKITVRDPVDMTDVAPTLSRILQIGLPNAVTGHEIIPIVSRLQD